jgi:hypothetical protein
LWSKAFTRRSGWLMISSSVMFSKPVMYRSIM